MLSSDAVPELCAVLLFIIITSVLSRKVLPKVTDCPSGDQEQRDSHDMCDCEQYDRLLIGALKCKFEPSLPVREAWQQLML